MTAHIFDVIIVGGGPGGYTAALYCARAGLDTLVLERLSPGGQMALTQEIDNYPGFDQSIDGVTLGEKMKRGAERFGAKTHFAEVLSASLAGEIKIFETADGVFRSRTAILATGASPRALGLDGEQALSGRGVHYCASCDGMFYKGKTVLVVGGGNTAAADALLLSRICKKVIVIHRRDTLRATKIYHAPLLQAENVEFMWHSAVTKLYFGDRLTGVQVENLDTGAASVLPCDGLFVSIGRVPATGLFSREVALDSAGYVVADETTLTNLPGVFAVGDIRAKALRQIVTAAADGAVAAHFAGEYLA